jgi:hypothetical protein
MARTYAHAMVNNTTPVKAAIRGIDNGKLDYGDIMSFTVHAPDRPRETGTKVELVIDTVSHRKFANAGITTTIIGRAMYNGVLQTLEVKNYPEYRVAVVRPA